MTIIVNNQIIKHFNFNAGECHVQLENTDIGQITSVNAFLQSSDDVMALLLTVDAIQRVNPQTRVELTLPYVPYARQDRVCEPGESLSIAVMANLINSLNCHKVIIYDPHSDVTPALINNVSIKTAIDFIKGSELQSLIQQEDLTLVSPDAGAEKKVRKLAEYLELSSMLTATKVRDTKTGKILETHIQGVKPHQPYLIVDDICDGGQTFIHLAKALKKQGAGDLYLYVTHGIFAKGLDTLFKYFKKIYCVNTWLEPSQTTNLISLED